MIRQVDALVYAVHVCIQLSDCTNMGIDNVYLGHSKFLTFSFVCILFKYDLTSFTGCLPRYVPGYLTCPVFSFCWNRERACS